MTVPDAGKRAFLTKFSALAGAASVEALACSTANASTSAAPVSDAERWTHDMAALGPRITAGPAHRKWITKIADALTEMGLEPVRYPVPVHYWEAKTWSLNVTDHLGEATHIPVASYVPYAGETSAAGINAQLIELGLGAASAYAGKDVAGKIVVVDKTFPADRSAKDVLGPILATYPADLDVAQISFVGQPTVGGGNNIGTLLATAKSRGAAAAIVILDLPPGAAVGQFTPHQQPEIGLPALHLNRVEGARLRRLMAAGPITARLTLQADRNDAATADYLAVKLAGNGKYKGAVCLLTHTDGQNAIEENGAAALLSIAKHFAGLPAAERERDMYFVFSACHMKAHLGEQAATEGVTPMAWLETQPVIAGDIAMVFTIEHLGGKAWLVSPDKSRYAPSGQREMWILGMTDNETLKSVTAKALEKTKFTKLIVTLPPGNLYGEGTSTQNRYPSITTAAGPVHLLQLWNNDRSATSLVDFAFMNEQVSFLTRLTKAFLSSPDFTLGRRARPPGWRCCS